MKRDMALIRKMVLALEETPTGWAPDQLTFEGYTWEQIGYHAYLMIQAGLAKGSEITNMEQRTRSDPDKPDVGWP